MNLNEKILRSISTIDDPIMFIGLAKGFNIRLVAEDTDTPRPFEEILDELLEHINGLSRDGKRKLLKLLRETH